MIVPVFLPHLGCGERCIYCDQVYITDIRRNNIPEMLEKYLAPVRERVEIGLYGGNLFGLDPVDVARLFAYFEPYQEKIERFRISTKPVPLREETMRILKEKRVEIIELGIPSFNDRILSTLNRRHTADDLRTSFTRLKAEGFQVALQVMVGLPEETMADIKETARNVVEFAPDYIRIYPLVVLKGTPLETMYREGAFVPLVFEEAVTRALYLYLRAVRHGIKVTKMGLTENEVIKERVIAGHYHPAFGYVVKSWAFRLAVLAKTRTLSPGGEILVTLNNRDVPHLLGYKRSNLDAYNRAGVKVVWETGEVGEGTFILTSRHLKAVGTIFDALTMIPS